MTRPLWISRAILFLRCVNHRHRRKIQLLLLAAMVSPVVFWIALPPYDADLDAMPEGTRILDCRGNLLRQTLGEEDQLCTPVATRQTGEWVVKALVAAEDKRFFKHPGVDPLAILRAATSNLIKGRRVSGASTLSTLVVKMTQPRRRTILTKVMEAHHALELESSLSKDDILSQFLSRAPFGGNLVGIETASRYYFGRATRDLSLSEAALLVGLPQSPSRLRPDRHYAQALKRRNYVLRRMLAVGAITREQYTTAMDQRPVVEPKPPAFRTPHFCDWILSHRPGRGEVKTTLDPVIQQLAEQVLRRQHERLSRFGVHGGAIVVIDVRSSALLAMVGSPDFWDARHAGQVNGAVALRSPGSTLKPFIYAMAFDEGQIIPASAVVDTPTSFSGYDPRNYNRRYAGVVSVRHALVESLNIPAVRTTRKVGIDRVVNRLRQLGITTLTAPPGRYGLSLAVGTCETRLLELANAYACLARLGVYQPLRVIETDPQATGTRLYSRETAYLVADVLSGSERGMTVDGHIADVRMPRCAWKTGTSNGLRDAWTIAYTPDFVVGIWFGNAGGSPSDALVGGSAAAPAARNLVRLLYQGRPADWYQVPDKIKTRLVCSVSGAPPSPDCPEQQVALAIHGVSDLSRCAVHRRGPDGRICETWPPEVESFLRRHGMGSPQSESSSLSIISPASGETIQLDSMLAPGEQRLALHAVAPSTTREVYWFVDGHCVGSGSPQEVFSWLPQPGRHTILCADTNGTSTSVSITVKAAPPLINSL